MREAIKVIREIAPLTNRVILFHSASGKDSIALLDLCHEYFVEVVCVFMYTVKDLEHINRYIAWAKQKYGYGVRFVQIPHYSVFSYIKVGFFGCEKNPKQKKFTLEEMTDIVRERFGIEWALFGFKQSDSMNRRLMLRGYTNEAINYKTKKAYPLSKHKNAEVLRYIEDNNLIKPETYGGEKQSAGADITDINYLLYLRNNYPADLQKVIDFYPMTERLLFDYDQKEAEAERDDRD